MVAMVWAAVERSQSQVPTCPPEIAPRARLARLRPPPVQTATETPETPSASAVARRRRGLAHAARGPASPAPLVPRLFAHASLADETRARRRRGGADHDRVRVGARGAPGEESRGARVARHPRPRRGTGNGGRRRGRRRGGAARAEAASEGERVHVPGSDAPVRSRGGAPREILRRGGRRGRGRGRATGSAEEESDDVEFLSSDADEDDEDDEDDEETEDDEEADPGNPPTRRISARI